jgi:hypothetical protein
MGKILVCTAALVLAAASPLYAQGGGGDQGTAGRHRAQGTGSGAVRGSTTPSTGATGSEKMGKPGTTGPNTVGSEKMGTTAPSDRRPDGSTGTSGQSGPGRR